MKDSTMTVAQILAWKYNTERVLREVFQEFTNRTGATISRIDLDSTVWESVTTGEKAKTLGTEYKVNLSISLLDD